MTDTTTHRVLISDKVNEICKQRLEEAGVEVDYRPGLKGQDLLDAIADCSGLVVRSATKVTPEVLNAGKKLQVVGRAGVGVDNIDIVAATHLGIAVVNTPEGNTISAAEHAVGLMMALARNIPQACADMKAGEWNRSAFMGTEIRGKTLGVVGLGKIGREVAQRARGLFMKVVCYDPIVAPAAAESVGAELLPLDDVLARSDFLTLHLPINDQTRGMFNTETLAQCKKGARIVNCARGGIIAEDAIIGALDSGHIAGIALDVFESEPPDMTAEFIRHPKVVVTPHLGASTKEAQTLVAEQIGSLIGEALVQGSVRNAVNMFPVDPQSFERAKPYLALAEQLGALQGQISDGSAESLTVEYYGAALEHPTGLLTSGVLMGILRQAEEGRVNLVNAGSIAQERGIRVDEMRTTGHEDYSNLITVTYQTRMPDGVVMTRRIAGSIFGEDSPRIVRIDGHSCDVIPHGKLLIMWNDDKPGVIGEVATVLGAHGVNIGFGSYGRDEPGGMAIMVYVLDAEIDSETLTHLRTLTNVRLARYASL
jgi:D-3-phosphoglycerate dehydrogenase / 2-oxoglutarate reductase